MQLSEHFTFEELSSTTNTTLLEINREQAKSRIVELRRVAVELLEPVRVGMRRPINVNSGYRGPTLNDLIGGSKTSQHMFGEAADFNVVGLESRAGQLEVVKWMLDDFKCRDYKWGQLLLERGCIHVSLGTKCEVAEYDVATKSKKPISELLA